MDGEESLSLVTSTLVLCVSGEYVGPCLPVSRGTFLRRMSPAARDIVGLWPVLSFC